MNIFNFEKNLLSKKFCINIIVIDIKEPYLTFQICSLPILQASSNRLDQRVLYESGEKKNYIYII